jgi:hypothetical protein
MLCTAVPTTEEALSSRLLHSTMLTLEVFSIYLGKVSTPGPQCGHCAGGVRKARRGIAPQA